MSKNTIDFITTPHTLWSRYNKDWKLAVNSYYGATEYRLGRYLKSYAIDSATPSEVINTYQLDDFGNQTGKFSTILNARSSQEAELGISDGTFYSEKLENVPVFPYTRLYVSEYNSILFRSPPVRQLPDDDNVNAFIRDVDGEGNSINEFMSMVDTFTTVYGVVWVSSIKPSGNDVPRMKMHNPLDVKNWEYVYNASGELKLTKIAIKIGVTDDMTIYQYMTNEIIQTIFVVEDASKDDADGIPTEAVKMSDGDTSYYVIESINELGYIPIRPIYQSTKIFNGVGHTPIFDIAQIQRSIYGDMGEIYSAVSYGSHPVNLVDEDTAQLNDGQIGAEPGTVIRVPPNVAGQPQYVYEFKATPLDSIVQLRELIDQKITNMNAVAMIRSGDLIKASTSGAHAEQLDSKLEAFVRKKATSLENAELQLWEIYYDWMGKEMPTDLTISYNRLYNKKGLTQEIDELKALMELVDIYNNRSDSVIDPTFAQDTKDSIKARLTQLLMSSYSENSL